MPLLGPTEDIVGGDYFGLGYLEAARQPRSTAYAAEAAQAFETMSTSVGLAAGVKAFMGGPKVSREEAVRRTKDAGVDIGDIAEEGISERALGLLIARQERIRRRETLINSSAMGGLERFGVSMAVTVGDPVNLLTIPLFGAGAWADAAVTGLGRAGRRLAVGAGAGAAVTAAVEPAYTYGANYIGDDYGLTDSLANIAFGAAAGGVLHVGAGVLGDAIRNPAERRAVAPAAMAQAAADQRIDVAAFARDAALETPFVRERVPRFEEAEQTVEALTPERVAELQQQGIQPEDALALFRSDIPPPDPADLVSQPAGTVFDTLESVREREHIDRIVAEQAETTRSVTQALPDEPINTQAVSADEDLAARTNEDLTEAKQTADALESKELENDLVDADQDVKDTDEFAKAYAAALDCGRRKGI